jgi:Ferritin-like domain
VSDAFDRTELLSGGARSAAGLLLAGSVFAAAPAVAHADTPSDNDLAYARLLVTAELLALDFYSGAIASRHFSGPALTGLRRARADEAKHRDAAASVLLAAGQVPSVAEDVDFSYPGGSFASRASIARLGARLESLFLGAYLGAVEGYEANTLKQSAARAAASEAQHLSVFTADVRGQRFGPAFPPALTIDRVSNALDRFTS